MEIDRVSFDGNWKKNHLSFTFHLFAFFGDIFVFEKIVRVFGDVYFPWPTSRFHSGKETQKKNNQIQIDSTHSIIGKIDGLPICQWHIITPDIELDTPCTHNTAQHGASVNADTHIHAFVTFQIE